MKLWLAQNVISPYRVELFKEIAQSPGIDFKLILLGLDSKDRPYFVLQPQDMPFPTESIRGLSLRLDFRRFIYLNPGLLWKMLREKPDVIICPGFSFATLLAFVNRILTNRKYVIWMEGTPITEQAREISRSFRKILAAKASAFVDAGTLSQKYLKVLIGEKAETKPFFTSYNCIETDRFKPTTLKSEFVKDLSARLPARNILYVGNLTEGKGVFNLLETYKLIVEQNPEPIGLVMVGTGPLEEEVQRFKNQHNLTNLFLEGFVKYSDIPYYYWACDLFILLSLEDANPLVIFEALTAGLPILCSYRAGNAVDFILDGENGYIVDPVDIQDTASKAITVLNWSTEKMEACRDFAQNIVKKANYKDSARAFVQAALAATGSRGSAG